MTEVRLDFFYIAVVVAANPIGFSPVLLGSFTPLTSRITGFLQLRCRRPRHLLNECVNHPHHKIELEAVRRELLQQL